MKKKEEEDMEKTLMDFYESWKADDTKIQEFKQSNQEIMSDSYMQASTKVTSTKVLIEPYIYYPEYSESHIQNSEKSGGLSLLTATQETKLTLLPFVKVIWSSKESPYSVGDIYIVHDRYTSKTMNPDYLEWNKLRAEKPRLENMIPMPPRILLGFDELHQYRYIIDKFKRKLEFMDYYTFLIPETGIILGKSTI